MGADTDMMIVDRSNSGSIGTIVKHKEFAERAGVSESTVIRLEKGDNGVSVGSLAMACLVPGEIDRISDFCTSGHANC